MSVRVHMKLMLRERMMSYNYDEWSEKHKDTIALWIGITYAIIMIVVAVLVIKYT